jgi:hypothetical protein
MISVKEFQARMRKLKVPAGFQVDLEVDTSGWGEDTMAYIVRNSMMEIRFDQSGCGHTNFDLQEDDYGRRTWRTFDRRGVEDSFYHLPLWDSDKTRYDVNKILQEQIKRVRHFLRRMETALPVPGIPGHTLSPNKLVTFKARLKKHGQVSFHPGGFGTGYIVTTHMTRGAKPAGKALVEFFGIGELFVSTIEMD